LNVYDLAAPLVKFLINSGMFLANINQTFNTHIDPASKIFIHHSSSDDYISSCLYNINL